MGVKTSRYRRGKTIYKGGKIPGNENFKFLEMKTSSSCKGVKTSIEGKKLDQLQEDLFKPLVIGFLRSLDFNAQYVPSVLKGSL